VAPKKTTSSFFLAGGVHDHGVFQAFGEEADAAVDFPQALLAVDVVAILGAVAITGGPGYDVHHLGAFRS
jgi:hypothetical protein